MNADLSRSSETFIDALQAGLAAFDSGDHEQAYQLLDKALDIEPDNVWGLLWKGATAPSPGEAVHWLEQVLALDPNNIHAEAGIAWARDQMGIMPSPEAEAATPQPPAAPEEVPDLSEAATPLSQVAEPLPQVAEPVAPEEAVPAEKTIPEWLQEEPSPATETLAAEEVVIPEWLREADAEPPETKTAVAVPVSEAPPVAEAPEAATEEVSEDFTLPAWLTEEIPETPAGEDVAKTVMEGVEPPEAAAAPAAEEDLPAWLQAEAPAEAAGTDNEVAYEHYQQGLAYYEENRLESAAHEFEAASELNPSHVETRNYLGSVYFLQGKPADAIDQFQQALKLDPDHAESHLNLGLVYQETGKADQAIEEFGIYLKLDPNSSIASEVKGFIDALRG